MPLDEVDFSPVSEGNKYNEFKEPSLVGGQDPSRTIVPRNMNQFVTQ